MIYMCESLSEVMLGVCWGCNFSLGSPYLCKFVLGLCTYLLDMLLLLRNVRNVLEIRKAKLRKSAKLKFLELTTD